MDAPLNHRPADEEVQVYRNEFYTGMLILARKLFML